VEDEMGKTDIANMKIQVESTTPLAQFTMDPMIDLKEPSEFILDAGPSFDVDEINGFDTLSYEWKFSDPEAVDIQRDGASNEKVVATFNKIGPHTIKLIVKDAFAKIAEVEKKVTITSVLRPELFVSPVASVWGTPINFVVRANEDIVSYSWDFGDGDARTLQTNRVSHTYSKIGQYTVKLSVVSTNGMENSLEKQIFV
jgi:PKD repeat protein